MPTLLYIIYKEGEIYPPVFVSTSENDEVAHPFHAEKFVATLKAKADRKSRVLLWVEPKAGHDNERKSLERSIENSANIYSFFLKELGVEMF